MTDRFEIHKDHSYYIKWQVRRISDEWPYQKMIMRFKTKRTATAYKRLLEGDRGAVGAFLSSYYKEHKDLPDIVYEMSLMLRAAPRG